MWISILVLIIGGLYMTYLLLQRQTIIREVALANGLVIKTDDALLQQVDVTRPSIIYFTADWCGSCITQQTPILNQLSEQMPDIQIIKIDADAHPEAVKRWGVMSLPRTVVVGKNRTPHAINVGVAHMDTLKQQINSTMQDETDDLHVNNNLKIRFKLPKVTVRPVAQNQS